MILLVDPATDAGVVRAGDIGWEIGTRLPVAANANVA